MNDTILAVLLYGFIGGFIATINRVFYYARNKNDITRKEDGTVNWGWCLFNNTSRILVATSASVFVGIVVMPHISFVDEASKYAIAGFSAIAGEQIWFVIGHKIKEFVDQTTYTRS